MSGLRLFLLCAVVILTAVGCGLRNGSDDVNNNVSFEGLLSQKIMPPDNDVLFTDSVAISGDYTIVGMVNGTGAYVFHRPGTNSWDDRMELILPDVVYGIVPSSVAMSDDYAIMGGSESVYVFRRTGTNNWDSGTKIVSPDAQEDDWFGTAVGISGDYVIIGAPYEDGGEGDPLTNVGATYVFHRTGLNTWDSGTKIVAPDAQEGDLFGGSIAISGDYAIIGAPLKDGGEDDPLTNSGAAYVFRRTDINTWDTGMKITSPDAQEGDLFGGSVAISGGDAIVGARGAAYIFK